MIISPCISICKTDPTTGYCYGCGRNNEEKKTWKLEETTQQSRTSVPSRPVRDAENDLGTRLQLSLGTSAQYHRAPGPADADTQQAEGSSLETLSPIQGERHCSVSTKPAERPSQLAVLRLCRDAATGRLGERGPGTSRTPSAVESNASGTIGQQK